MKEFSEHGMTIYQFLIYESNFSYLIRMENGLDAIAIDPGDAKITHKWIEDKGVNLKAILITHTHGHHIEGVHDLKEETDCLVIGSPSSSFEEQDQDVSDGEESSFGPFQFEALATPGHTRDSQAYYFPDFPALFSGDTLFLGGCGRIFEGTADEMLLSLKKMARLPQHTRIFCGHDYYEENLRFALTLEPENEELKKRLEAHQNHPITSTTIGEDLLINPFLRLGDEGLQKALGFTHLPTELEVLNELRSRRNLYHS